MLLIADLIFTEYKNTTFHQFLFLFFFFFSSLFSQQNPTLDWRNRLPGETEQTNDEVKWIFSWVIYNYELWILNFLLVFSEDLHKSYWCENAQKNKLPNLNVQNVEHVKKICNFGFFFFVCLNDERYMTNNCWQIRSEISHNHQVHQFRPLLMQQNKNWRVAFKCL